MFMVFNSLRITYSDLMMLLAILAGFGIVLWIFVISLHQKQSADNKAKPVEKAMAKLIEKPSLPNGAIPSLTYIPLLFEVENGQRVRLSVKATTTYVVGDAGELVWQGTNLISFTPQ